MVVDQLLTLWDTCSILKSTPSVPDNVSLSVQVPKAFFRILNYTDEFTLYRAYGDQPILAFRMVLDGVVAPDGEAATTFVKRTIPEIDKELAYWKKAKTVRVVRSRKGVPQSFPIPVRLFRLQVRMQFKSNKKVKKNPKNLRTNNRPILSNLSSFTHHQAHFWFKITFVVEMNTQKSQRPLSDLEGQVEEQWEDYADTLVSRGMAAYGDVDIDSALYSEWARGIEPDGLSNGMRAMAL